jgi:hypothetical protein
MSVELPFWRAFDFLFRIVGPVGARIAHCRVGQIYCETPMQPTKTHGCSAPLPSMDHG